MKNKIEALIKNYTQFLKEETDTDGERYILRHVIDDLHNLLRREEIENNANFVRGEDHNVKS